MLNWKELFYSLHDGILEVYDGSALIFFSHQTAHNLYKINLKEATNLVTILYWAMKAGISNSAADLSIWYQYLIYLNEDVIKQFAKIILELISIISSNNRLLYCNICITAEMIRQLYEDPQSYFTITIFQLQANIGRKRDIYAIFQSFCYFIFFICKTTSYILVRFFKKKSDVLLAF